MASMEKTDQLPYSNAKKENTIYAISITIRRFRQTPVASQQQCTIQAVSAPSGEGGRNYGVNGATEWCDKPKKHNSRTR